MTAKQRLRKRIGKAQRRIDRTERIQAVRRDLVRRLQEATGDELVALVEFHLDRRIDDDPDVRASARAKARRADKTGRAPLETSTVSGSRGSCPTRRAAPTRERIKRA